MVKEEPTNVYEGIGILVVIVLMLVLACLPGMMIAQIQKNSWREDVINELCNKTEGKYDFCKLNTVTYRYVEKDNNEKSNEN